MKVHAYYRISKDTSDLDNQRREVEAACITKYGRKPDADVSEIVSGRKKANERDLTKLLKSVVYGDVFVCASTTRIGRDFYDTLETTRVLRERGVTFVALQQNLTVLPDDDTMSKFLLAAYAFFGENERKEISARTKAALQTRKDNGLKNGRAFGSFKEPTEKQKKELGKYLDAGRYYKAEMAKILEFAKPTFDRWLLKNADIEARRIANRDNVSPFYQTKH